MYKIVVFWRWDKGKLSADSNIKTNATQDAAVPFMVYTT